MSISRILIMFTLMIIIYCGSHFYIAQRLYQWLNPLLPVINIKIYIVIFLILASSLFLGFVPLPSGIKLIIKFISAYWLGIFLYLLIFTAAADVIMLFVKLIKIIPGPIPQKILFYKGLIVVILTACTACYGLFNASQIKLVSYNIQTAKPVLQPEIKIALISDLHLGSINSEKNLIKIVRRINEIEPDIVCIAGDIFNDDFNSLRNPSKAAELLRSINSTFGVYACLGNHDGGETLNEMKHFLEQSNIKLLNDDYVIIDNRLVLIGRLDSSPIGGFGNLKRQNTAKLMDSINTELPVIVMDHNPSKINQYGKETDLIVSGHTHKGQLFPARLITRAIFDVDYGYYKKDNDSPHVIVTSGAGTWGTPMRVGTNNEVVSIIFK